MSQPKLLTKPWAVDGLKNEIPANRSTSVAQEAATYTEGFPSITMTPIAMGGKPPSGKDMNGVLYELSAHTVYLNQGSRYRFDADFCTAIGGYPKGAVLMNNAGTAEYISLIDGNTANFNVSTVNINGKWAVWSSADVLAGKADKTTTITAGNGLTGGGNLTANHTLSLGTPGKITATSTNTVTAASHTHEIDKAGLTAAGIVRLSSSTNSTDETMAATPKAVREAMLAAQSAVSSGAVAFFAGNTAPAGWLKANGAAVSRTTYAPLFAAIGTTYGAGNGSTTFNLPDLRGEFVRGWDDGRGIDGGRDLGSWQRGTYTAADCQSSSAATYAPLGRNDTLNHLTYNEKMGVDNINNSDYPGVYGVVGTSRSNMFTKQGWNAGSIGSTRPRNVALLACIKI
ncbi:microcystin-dependent protein [Neisseria sp. HSC-16F19]|nr:tail fiber protein [Neisseria sp. HSC-16F19]MCP2041646.1 microcystin-dependent protein [Neisseria sp. HSC-16F19]